MDKLLNVKEAAALLNVSQMTIRRWTNSGLLKCYRLGRKRERRFSPQDLREFLTGDQDSDKSASQATPGISLGYGDLEVPDGTHLTHLYYDLQEALGLQASFLRQGLESGETVLVVAPDDRKKQLLQILTENGLDTAGLIRQKRLHHDGGRQSPADLSAYISQIALSSPGRFRLIGDMAWTINKKWQFEDLKNLEENSNSMLRAGNLFLCQYGLGEFSGRETMMAAETHQYAIYQGRLKESLLF
ncbi:MAG: MEDS domain-containing protein [Desulfurivibrionaceae bacterium]